MKEEPVVQVRNLGKVYSRKPNFLKPSYWLHYLSRNKHQLMSDEFWALKNINFELKKGECIGIIGKNGAGKSTILKILAKVTEPTIGGYLCNGKLGALIEVGAGFHPEMTGRENIYLNGSILGMSKQEINAKFKSIVDFAEMWDFIDTPIKKYSSGMYVRLGFATAIHTEPDILLVDEILAVGDENFRVKCYNKIRELMDKGVCIILVTHQMYLVRRYCDRVVYLKKGQIEFQGDKDKAVEMYLKENFEVEKLKQVNTGVEILSKRIFDKTGKERASFKTGEDIFIDVELNFPKKLKGNMIRFWLTRPGGYGDIPSIFVSEPVSSLLGKKKIKFKIKKNPLCSGNFVLGLAILDKNSKFALMKGDLLVFEIIGGDPEAIVEMPFELEVITKP